MSQPGIGLQAKVGAVDQRGTDEIGRNRVAVGNDLRTATQGSSCLATLGFGTESRWDSDHTCHLGLLVSRGRDATGCAEERVVNTFVIRELPVIDLSYKLHCSCAVGTFRKFGVLHPCWQSSNL